MIKDKWYIQIGANKKPVDNFSEAFDAALIELGEGGWELVGFTSETGYKHFIFKRPMP